MTMMRHHKQFVRVFVGVAILASSWIHCSSATSSTSTVSDEETTYQQSNLRGVVTATAADVTDADLEDPRKGLITDLPGLDYETGFRQYSGYLTVSKEHDRNIFYWYIESENDPETDPVVLWTNGGPGCSGLIGLAREHGPYFIDRHMQLSPNPYSWNKVANMLYIEQPAGVGFSYSSTSSDYQTGDHQAAVDNYLVIRAFLERYPERKTNGFYISSESYGGHYMPQLALEILRRNTDGFINFKGVLVGNPYVDLFSNTLGQIGVYYQHGLTPAYLYNNWMASCGTPDTYDSPECNEIVDAISSKAGNGINPYGTDYPVCRESSAEFPITASAEEVVVSSRQLTSSDDRRSVQSSQVLQLNRFRKSRDNKYNNLKNEHDSPPFLPPQDHYLPCSELHTEMYLNRPDVRKALHIAEDKSPKSWADCSSIIDYNRDDFAAPVIALYQNLVSMAVQNEHQLNIMVYSGDDDSVCATAGTQYWIWDLGVKPHPTMSWEPWKVDDQTAGYVTTFDLGNTVAGGGGGGANFTFATVHGAGHEVPAYRPMEALELLKKYFSGKW